MPVTPAASSFYRWPSKAIRAVAVAFAAVALFIGAARECAAIPVIVEKVEVESNNTAATANPLDASAARVTANIWPVGDADYFSFHAYGGDRVFAAVMTSHNSRGTFDSELTLFASDGVTVLESDQDDGSLGGTSSSIAGASVPISGMYYLRVRYNISVSSTIHPYELYMTVQSGAPVTETESNNSFPGQNLPASGWVIGAISSAADTDFFSVSLQAGETVFISLDLDPERDGATWNGYTGLGAFGTPPNILVVNDGNVVSPNSEAFFLTAKNAGLYSVFVGVPAGITTTNSYQLNVSRLPPPAPGLVFSSTNVPLTIPTSGTITSALVIPGNPIIGKLRVTLNLTHTYMQDLDIQLMAPGGNVVGLLSDIGTSTPGSQTTMDLKLDDGAAIPSSFTIVQGLVNKPELAYRLRWFKGQPAGGTWTLIVRDDSSGDGGNLLGWSLEIVEDVPPIGKADQLFFSDFEAGAAGFAHSGTFDEWERGTPNTVGVTSVAAFIGCNSGTQCWKTDLDGTYENSSDQVLESPNITLTGVTTGALYIQWAMKFQIESSVFDAFSITVSEVGNPANSQVVYQFLDADMQESVGLPSTMYGESAGWGTHRVEISKFRGKTIRITIRLVSDSTLVRAGLAIDDVRVARYPSPPRAYVPSTRRAATSAW